MKKLIVAVAAVAMAVAAQAGAFKWTTSAEALGIDVEKLAGNGSYAADGALAKGNTTLMAIMTIYDGSGNVVGTSGAEKKVSYAMKDGTISTSFTVNGTAASTAYTYDVVITGTQNDITGVIGDWDYTAATISAKSSGSFTSAPSGTTTIAGSIPTSWTVAGAVKTTPTPTPEPTSGLLLVLGMAGLALRRRRA